MLRQWIKRLGMIALVLSIVLTSAPAALAQSSSTLEAESAALSGGAQVNTNHTGYTGSGFVDGFWNAGATVTFTVNAPSAGPYEVTLRYSAGDTGVTSAAIRTLTMLVNGSNMGKTSLPKTTNWDTWATKTQTLMLNAGDNTVAYKYGSCDTANVNLDNIAVAAASGAMPTSTPTGTPSPVVPATITSGATYKIVSKCSGRAVEVSNASTDDGANVQQWSDVGAAQQQWTIESVGNDYYKLVNLNSGKALEVAGASTADGANVDQRTYTGATNQQWQILDVGGGSVILKARHSNKLLDLANGSSSNGANIDQWSDTGATSQRWQLTLVKGPNTDASRPVLTFANAGSQSTLGTAYTNALRNLLDVNTVPYDDATYNSTGFLSNPPGTFIRAGGGYNQPWTRDASVNSWNAASMLEPVIARNTLWSVVKRQGDGSLIVQQDNQWWDQSIWIISAWNHYLVTGDQTFLTNAYQTAVNTLNKRKSTNYNTTYGLFQGPAFFNDGISGYPAPPADATESKGSFVLDYTGTSTQMTLSSNALYYQAYRSAALMATELGKPSSEIANLNNQADSLKTKINQYFWIPSKGQYGYFLHNGDGVATGTLDESEEGTGLAFVILFGIADASQTQSILQNAHIQPYGIVDVYPHFARYSDSKPGRHNVIVWPMIQGFWADAAAKAGNETLFANEVSDLASLANDSDKGAGIFWEIYNAQTGAVDGGWQTGAHWGSVSNQTWSATAYLRMIYQSLFGMHHTTSGLAFQPFLPSAWGDVSLTGVPYRGMTLNISLHGAGNTISSFKLDGVTTTNYTVPNNLTGTHTVDITLTGGGPTPTPGPTATPTPTMAPLPNPWQHGDVGSVGQTGSATYSGGTFTVDGGGADIWETADEFHYVYQTLNGDGTITARVSSLENTNAWAKAGVMIRETLNAGSKHAFMAITPGNGLAFQRRTTTGGTSSHTSGGTASAPYWVRLTRSGNTFTGYASSDGTTWTQVGSATISMSSSVIVGLAVTSHNDATLATGMFDNVSVSGGVSPTATPTFTPGPSATPTRTPTPTATLPSGTNLALNKPATASASCNTNEGPEKAVNGSWTGGNSDKWCDNTSASKWWRVDLGATYTVSKFVIYHAGAGGESTTWNTRDFNLQISTDGVNWTTVVTVSGNTASTTTNNITTTTARYVRLNVTAPEQGTGGAARIYEVEVYGN